MAAHRKYAPKGAAETIRTLAAKGFGLVGIGLEFKVSKHSIKRWMDEDETLERAFEEGKEIERQALHNLVVQSAAAGKGPNINAFFLLKARHGYKENDPAHTNVNVSIPVAPVMVVKDFGSDEAWSFKIAEQQRRLIGAPEPTETPYKALPVPSETVEPQSPINSSEGAPVAVEAPSWIPTVPVSPRERRPVRWKGNA